MQNTVKVEADFNGRKRSFDVDSAFILVGQHRPGAIHLQGGVSGHVCDPVVTGILEGLWQSVGGWRTFRCLVRLALQRLFGGGGQE